MKKILLVVLAMSISLMSCISECIDTTYLNGVEYSVYTYEPSDGECYCDETTYTSGGDTFTNVCSQN
tara:strand:+ start:2074 stop:2274 length:201 start_codon:yes stop_codon:yes gene_type:complete